VLKTGFTVCTLLLLQARSRVDQLLKLGHVVDKVEFILMGGTFMSLPGDYRDYFIRNLHDALSGRLLCRCCYLLCLVSSLSAAVRARHWLDWGRFICDRNNELCCICSNCWSMPLARLQTTE
jgi:hypothetical protein